MPDIDLRVVAGVLGAVITTEIILYRRYHDLTRQVSELRIEAAQQRLLHAARPDGDQQDGGAPPPADVIRTRGHLRLIRGGFTAVLALIGSCLACTVRRASQHPIAATATVAAAALTTTAILHFDPATPQPPLTQRPPVAATPSPRIPHPQPPRTRPHTPRPGATRPTPAASPNVNSGTTPVRSQTGLTLAGPLTTGPHHPGAHARSAARRPGGTPPRRRHTPTPPRHHSPGPRTPAPRNLASQMCIRITASSLLKTSICLPDER
jgi:hypothetical protein